MQIDADEAEDAVVLAPDPVVLSTIPFSSTNVLLATITSDESHKTSSYEYYTPHSISLYRIILSAFEVSRQRH